MPKNFKKRYSSVEMDFLEIAKKMPPSYHTLPNQKFDIKKSEAVKWLMKQPETMNFVWERIVNRGKQLKPIEYNKETGEWQGINYIAHDGSFGNCDVCDNKTCEEGYCSWEE